MADELEIYAKKLTDDPFNIPLREEYASALSEADLIKESLAQWRLLEKQAPNNSEYAARIEVLLNSKVEEGTEIADGNIQLKLIQGDVVDRSNVVSIGSTETIRFSDIAGMVEVKKLIKRRIIDPFVKPGLFQRFKKKTGGGVLLYGPPGCGKTMLAKAIATECNAAFYAVGISDILNMYIGESESNLAGIFDRARSDVPAVIFFDELDALAYSRSKANSDYTRTLVNEFLGQLDGVSGGNEKILILGATNMPWDVDDAMKRPGRFDRQIFIPPPDHDAKVEMLRIKLVDVPCDDLDLDQIVKRCNQFSGADIDGLIEEAKDVALDSIIENNAERNLTQADFNVVVDSVVPTTTDWLKTARNLVKFGNAGGTYREVEKYLRSINQY